MICTVGWRLLLLLMTATRKLSVPFGLVTITSQRLQKLIEWVCSCNISYGTQMKEKIRLTGLLLGKHHECIITNPNQCVLQCNGNIPVHFQRKKFKVTPSAWKVMLTIFRDSRGVLLAHLQKRGENANSIAYC
jgi:hypothetical protein